MKQEIRKAIFLAVCVSIFIILTSGCEEEEQAPSIKKSRLIAAENVELQKQLVQKNKEIERLKSLLEKCNAEKATQKQQMDKEMKAIGTEMMEIFEKYVLLQEENERLKKQIEELKRQ